MSKFIIKIFFRNWKLVWKNKGYLLTIILRVLTPIQSLLYLYIDLNVYVQQSKLNDWPYIYAWKCKSEAEKYSMPCYLAWTITYILYSLLSWFNVNADVMIICNVMAVIPISDKIKLERLNSPWVLTTKLFYNMFLKTPSFAASVTAVLMVRNSINYNL